MKLPVKTRTLDEIQKTMGSLNTFAKVVEIVAIICASLLAAFALFGSIFLGEISKSTGVLEIMIGDKSIMPIGVITYAVNTALVAVAFGLLRRYFAVENEDGSPFTHNGADKLMKTGIVWCVLGIACAVGSLVMNCVSLLTSIPSDTPGFEALRQEMLNNFVGNISDYVSPVGEFLVILGVAIVIVSLVFKHGAETFDALKDLTGDKSFVKAKQDVQE